MLSFVLMTLCAVEQGLPRYAVEAAKKHWRERNIVVPVTPMDVHPDFSSRVAEALKGHNPDVDNLIKRTIQIGDWHALCFISQYPRLTPEQNMRVNVLRQAALEMHLKSEPETTTTQLAQTTEGSKVVQAYQGARFGAWPETRS
ncbi:MAG: hypothetical protein AAB323_00740 [Pseudomonadota bacterium]